MISGIINIYKEKGYTSHDVVAKLRGILHQKKIGHTGTLDPDAEGVLLVCIGKGTGVCELLTDKDKTYEAVMLLGVATDTQDISGNVLEKKEPVCDLQTILDAIDSFVGEIQQVPPMYSALKHNGKKLYELARQGMEVERKPRKIHIQSIRVNEYDEEMHTVRMTISCSKGTYIRTLCDDIGKKLGCGACMKELKRLRVGKFGLDSAITLGQVAAKTMIGSVMDCVIPIDSIFSDFREAFVTEIMDIAVHNGNPVPFGEEFIKIEGDENIFDGENVRLYDSKGTFVGVYVCDNELLRPLKMFYDSENDIQNNE